MLSFGGKLRRKVQIKKASEMAGEWRTCEFAVSVQVMTRIVEHLKVGARPPAGRCWGCV